MDFLTFGNTLLMFLEINSPFSVLQCVPRESGLRHKYAFIKKATIFTPTLRKFDQNTVRMSTSAPLLHYKIGKTIHTRKLLSHWKISQIMFADFSMNCYLIC